MIIRIALLPGREGVFSITWGSLWLWRGVFGELATPLQPSPRHQNVEKVVFHFFDILRVAEEVTGSCGEP